MSRCPVFTTVGGGSPAAAAASQIPSTRRWDCSESSAEANTPIRVCPAPITSSAAVVPAPCSSGTSAVTPPTGSKQLSSTVEAVAKESGRR